MNIDVSIKLIRRGRRRHYTKCPVALAIKEKINGDVAVGVHFVSIGNNLYFLPEHVSSFIHKYDANLRVDPLSFELPINEKL